MTNATSIIDALENELGDSVKIFRTKYESTTNWHNIEYHRAELY